MSRDIGVARIAANDPLPLPKRRKTSHGGDEPGRTPTVAYRRGAHNSGLVSSVDAGEPRAAENSGEALHTEPFVCRK